MHKISFNYLTKPKIKKIIILGSNLLNVKISEEGVDRIIINAFKMHIWFNIFIKAS